MPGIWEYPDLGELENFISRSILQAAQTVSEQQRPISSFIQNLSVEKILIVEEWGEGTAVPNEDNLHAVIFFGFTGPDESEGDAIDAVIARAGDDVTEGRINIPSDLRQATPGIQYSGVSIDNLNETLVDMNNAGLELVFDLTELEAIDLITGRPPDEYTRIPLNKLLEDEEEVEEGAEVDDETPDLTAEDIDITDVSPLPEEMLPEVPEAGPEFPDINENLRPFAVSEDTLEIPAGKERKQIDVREPYNFEVEMALPGLQVSSQVFSAVLEEIAQPVGAGTLGQEEPVGTYPRTGLYVRNYLKFRGTAYSYEMYKNLVYYAGYISTLHDINVKAGSYQSFRDYMYVLEEIPERGGPRLVEPLSQQQAAAQELETTPDHPTIDGAKAPWLKGRQYYDLIDENDEHEAWFNAFDYLHGDEE